MLVDASAVVIDVCRYEMLRHGLHCIDEIAVEVRVAKIQTDTHLDVEHLLHEMHQGVGPRQLVGDDLDRDSDAESLGELPEVFDAAARAVPTVVGRRGLLGSGQPQMDDKYIKLNATGDLQRQLRFGQRVHPCGPVGTCQRQGRAPSPVHKALADWCVHAVQGEVRFSEPLLEISDCRLVVIIEVRPGGEHLYGLESLGPYLNEVIATEPLVMMEMCRNSKQALARHKSTASFYRSSSRWVARQARRRVKRGYFESVLRT